MKTEIERIELEIIVESLKEYMENHRDLHDELPDVKRIKGKIDDLLDASFVDNHYVLYAEWRIANVQ